jgi:hypothetical protein
VLKSIKDVDRKEWDAVAEAAVGEGLTHMLNSEVLTCLPALGFGGGVREFRC